MKTGKKLLCVFLPAAVLGILIPAFAYGYSPKGGESAESVSWMSQVDDATPLSALSIPATHDTMALHSLADVAGKCQDVGVAEQLEMGARMLDMRLKLVNNQLACVHGYVGEKYAFSTVLKATLSFLEAHPSETVIYSVKEDDDAVNSSISFAEAVAKAFSSVDASHLYLQNAIPTLQEARGKIVLISRYSEANIGIPAHAGWEEPEETVNTFDIPLIHVQDYYKVHDIAYKESEVAHCLEYSSTHQDVYTMNFVSGYFTSGFPPTYSVPVAKIMNPYVKGLLEGHASTGILLCDFLTQELSEAIWRKNL